MTNITTSCPSNCEEINDGDTAFMIMASTFVMLQTPALGLAQAGMIRRKNALSMLMQTLTGLAIGSLLWFVIGFTLTFGPSQGGIIGNLDHIFLLDVGIECCFPLSTATTLPGILFAGFQMMFALMVPVIVTGAWAERMEFKAFAWFTFLWPILVYYPLAHWIWNSNGWLAKYGVLDFAGGLTIHSSTGVAALVVSSILAGRMKGHTTIGHHNLPMFVLGGALIWGGWYSFNAGSAYRAGPQAAVAMMNTHISASSGAAVWILLHYYSKRKWSLTEIMSGAFAGLAAITPGSGFVLPWTAVIIGASGSCSAFIWVTQIKPRIGVDDALDVAALQGVPGILGTFAVGLFAEYSLDASDKTKLGLLRGGDGTLLATQTLGVFVTICWTGFWTYLLMIWMRRFVGIDVSPECEEKGLDFIQIGEQAYDETLAPILDLGHDVLSAKLIDAAQAGDLPRIKALVQVGASPGAADYDGRTPLHLSAAGGHLEVMKYLNLQHGVDIHAVDRYGNTPLHDAMVHNRSEAVRWLKKMGAQASADTGYQKDRDILQAAAEGNLEEVKWRLKLDPCLANTKDYDRRTPLHVAASEGHHNVVRELLRQGAAPNALDRWGLSAYKCAVKARHATTAEELANWILREKEELASMNGSLRFSPRNLSSDSTQNKSMYQMITGQTGARRRKNKENGEETLVTIDNINKNHQNRVPLLADFSRSKKKEENSTNHKSSSKTEQLEIVTPTMTTKMSVEARALINAAECGDLREIKKLIVKGADINQADYDGRTSAHLASANGHVAVVQYLIQNKASLDAFDRFGRTPLQDALDMGHTKIAQILRIGGATVTNPALARTLCSAAAIADFDALKTVELTGGNLGCSDYDGRTAMHLAASEGQLKVVQWLIERGVRCNPRDRWGGTPIDDARREGYPAIVDLLGNNLSDEERSSFDGISDTMMDEKGEE